MAYEKLYELASMVEAVAQDAQCERAVAAARSIRIDVNRHQAVSSDLRQATLAHETSAAVNAAVNNEAKAAILKDAVLQLEAEVNKLP